MKIIYSAIVILAFTLFAPAHASAEQTPLIHVEEGTEEKIVSDYADHQGWCDRPTPTPEPGQITIDWKHDEQGRCLQITVKENKPRE